MCFRTMTTNYVPNATGLIANQPYRSGGWGPNVTNVPIAASHSPYNVNQQVRYASFTTGLAPFHTAYTTHAVVSEITLHVSLYRL